MIIFWVNLLNDFRITVSLLDGATQEFYFCIVFENIEVFAKAHGQIWCGRLQVTLWSAYPRQTKTILVRPTRLLLGGSAARPLRPQIKDGVVLEYWTEGFAWVASKTSMR